MDVDPKQWTLLIIDDEPHNVGVVQHVLQFHGARVLAAGSGTEGLDVISRHRLDFVLLDIQMPHMSGFDVLAKIRENPRSRDLLVIALTSHAMTGDYERAMTAGFNGYITKPISVQQIVQQIGLILNDNRRLS
jgi:two-component system, cell cycle response regulator DivK